MPFDNRVKKGEKFENDVRHSSGGVIELGGELHVKGKNVFDVTNLGGELV